MKIGKINILWPVILILLTVIIAVFINILRYSDNKSIKLSHEKTRCLRHIELYITNMAIGHYDTDYIYLDMSNSPKHFENMVNTIVKNYGLYTYHIDRQSTLVKLNIYPTEVILTKMKRIYDIEDTVIMFRI